jgi:type VI secretion system secreted protein Hcp
MFKDKRTAMVGTMVAAVFLSLLTFMAPGKALAAYNCFLGIDGIPGESMDRDHKDWIDIVSWSFGETFPAATASTAGSLPGRLTMQDFKFTMRTNKASPILFQACAMGKNLTKVVLEVWGMVGVPSGRPAKLLQIKLEDVRVSSFVILGNSMSTQAYPMEEISLNFARIKVTYSIYLPNGTGGGQVEAGFDVKAGKAY